MKRRLNNFRPFFDRTGLGHRSDPVRSIVAFLSVVGAIASSAQEPVWTVSENRILKDEAVFVESGVQFPILGVLGGKSGSVLVSQPKELTQIFDEDGDGKGDFFRALIGNLPSGNRIISPPMEGQNGELFVSIDRAGELVDLVSWKPDGSSAVVFSMPKTSNHIAISPENVLAAIISDAEGDWIAMAQLPTAVAEEPPAPNSENPDATLRALPLVEPVKPVLNPAVRIPKILIGEGNSISDLSFVANGGFLLTASDGTRFLVNAEKINGRIQGSVIRQSGDAEFSIRKIELLTDGFEISLSFPVDRGIGGVSPIPFQILSGKLVGESPLEPVAIGSAVVEPDGLTLNLIPQVLLPEQIYVFDLSALKSEDGDAISGEKAAYTVIVIPDSTVVPPVIEGPIPDATIQKAPEPDGAAEKEANQQ